MPGIRGQALDLCMTTAEKLDVNAVVDEAGKRLVCTLSEGAGVPVRVDLRAWSKRRPAWRPAPILHIRMR
jgi:hypothetical protein